MKFALISQQRVEAQPKLRAMCPACGREVIANRLLKYSRCQRDPVVPLRYLPDFLFAF